MIYQRPGSRDWVHSDTNLRFSNIEGAHLADPLGAVAPSPVARSA